MALGATAIQRLISFVARRYPNQVASVTRPQVVAFVQKADAQIDAALPLLRTALAADPLTTGFSGSGTAAIKAQLLMLGLAALRAGGWTDVIGVHEDEVQP